MDCRGGFVELTHKRFWSTRSGVTQDWCKPFPSKADADAEAQAWVRGSTAADPVRANVVQSGAAWIVRLTFNYPSNGAEMAERDGYRVC
jgi:hypothetical protein